MLEPRSGHTATLLPDGKVLIAGGMRRNQDFYRSAELYDPTAGKFSPTGPMSIGRVGHIAVLLRSGKVLIAGGWVRMGGTDSAELYDPATGIWSAAGYLKNNRFGHTATLLASGQVLVAGGDVYFGSISSSTELYDPAGNTLGAVTPTMNTAREFTSAIVLLPNGEVLIAGGYDNAFLSSAELYTP